VEMSPQQLVLSWKDHNGALVSVVGIFERKIPSFERNLGSYFELLFSQESEKNPIVILKDVKFQELEAAVNLCTEVEVEVVKIDCSFSGSCRFFAIKG
ncbi:Protein of unknown function, partial [Gryllus bimaculatus]